MLPSALAPIGSLAAVANHFYCSTAIISVPDFENYRCLSVQPFFKLRFPWIWRLFFFFFLTD